MFCKFRNIDVIVRRSHLAVCHADPVIHIRDVTAFRSFVITITERKISHHAWRSLIKRVILSISDNATLACLPQATPILQISTLKSGVMSR